MFQTLHDAKVATETELGIELIREDPEETRIWKRLSHIWITSDADLNDEDRWDEYFDWLMKNGERFHEVFPPRLQE